MTLHTNTVRSTHTGAGVQFITKQVEKNKKWRFFCSFGSQPRKKHFIRYTKRQFKPLKFLKIFPN